MSTHIRKYINSLIGEEISKLTKYYDELYQFHPRKDDDSTLFSIIEAKGKAVINEGDSFPELADQVDKRTAFLLNGTINFSFDIQQIITQVKSSLSRTSRLAVVAYNPYLEWLYLLANKIGIRRGEVPTTFVTRVDLENFAKLSGYSLVRAKMIGYFPFKLFGLGDIINRIAANTPFIRWFALAYVAILRPVIPETSKPSLTIVIPARNEKGNIESAITRLPDLGCGLEVIFVEGHSSDGTWEEILRVIDKYKESSNIRAFQQTGKGKADAVRLGFSKATGDLLTILDADLTMPPEMLGRFYQAYCEGHADFINGSRLVYPMEGNAMRPLNRLGNIFFAKLLSWVLGIKIGDSLCGTKLCARHDYQRMVAWRRDFGDFDPFGDFELLFPAATLGLGIIDIPIRYRDRTYGTTNISRFRHGFMLLRMTLIGFFKVKLGFSRV